jgi:cobalt/nickel transport system permease protein
MNAPSHGPQNWLYRLPAGLKLAVALAVIFGTVLMPGLSKVWFVSVAVCLFVGLVIARVSCVYLLKRWLYLAPFVLVVAVTNMFQSGHRLSWELVALKSTVSLVSIILLIQTTPFSEILRTLQALRAPGLLVTTMVLMQRYMFVLSDEAGRMRRARASRTFARGRRFEWQLLSSVIGQLFLRASDRAERIYQAMCARGWR